MSEMELQHKTWENLVRLTENVTPDQINTILTDILHIGGFNELSQTQANELERVLSSLPNLRHILWEGVIEAIEKEQATHMAKGIKPIASAEATALAEIITQRQIDKLTTQFIKSGLDMSFFGRDTPIAN